MSEPWSEDDGILREWAPLSGLLREIPLTVRRGLFLENVSLTCVDAVSEYIAVGTNIGVVYWYHRESHNIQRLRPEVSLIYNLYFICNKFLLYLNLFRFGVKFMKWQLNVSIDNRPVNFNI